MFDIMSVMEKNQSFPSNSDASEEEEYFNFDVSVDVEALKPAGTATLMDEDPEQREYDTNSDAPEALEVAKDGNAEGGKSLPVGLSSLKNMLEGSTVGE